MLIDSFGNPIVPSNKELLLARDEFASLLTQPGTTEPIWQAFFTSNPFVLSRSLPLQFDKHRIRPAKPGQSEADFIFYPISQQLFSAYGLIELKRPSHIILRTKRHRIAQLADEAMTAVRQAQTYSKKLNCDIIECPNRLLFVGNPIYVFIIIGLSKELLNKVQTDDLKLQLSELLPSGFQILPYDTVYQLFSDTVPPQLHFLVPAIMPRSLSVGPDCPECGTPMNKADIDTWGGDSDGYFPRYVSGYSCPKCYWEIEEELLLQQLIR